MNTFTADYFDGRSSIRHGVEVTVLAGRASLRGSTVALEFDVGELEIAPRMGNTPARIAVPGGGVLVTGEYERVAQLLGAPPHRTLAHRMESRPAIVLAALAGALAACALLYWAGIPWAARVIASHLPANIDASLSREVMKSLDQLVFKPTALEAATRIRLQDEFAALVSAAGVPKATLQFRNGTFIGANAFALPGGTVIVTDQLVTLLGDERKVAAVMAHEIGHVHHNHTTRHVLQDSMTALMAMAFAGDISALSGVVSAIPAMFMHSGYSRGFEREADAFAFALLKQTGRPPSLLGESLQLLQDEHRNKSRFDEEIPVGYLSTHPPTKERIEAAAAASR